MSDDKNCCCGHHHDDDCEHGEDCCCGHHHEEAAEDCCCGHHHDTEDIANKMPEDVPLPAPTLITLASSIATQAMVSMGIFPNPGTGKSEFYFNQARHLIDTIDLLIKKTEGNRTDEETRTLSGVLSELQMLFVAAQTEKSRRDANPET